MSDRWDIADRVDIVGVTRRLVTHYSPAHDMVGGKDIGRIIYKDPDTGLLYCKACGWAPEYVNLMAELMSASQLHDSFYEREVEKWAQDWQP